MEPVKTELRVKYTLIAVWGCMNMAYYLAYFFLADLEGNMFVNGIIFGCAEVVA